MREAYGYSDEYILSKTPEWLNDALERIFKNRLDALKTEGKMHGVTFEDADEDFTEEPKDADDADLREAGLSLG